MGFDFPQAIQVCIDRRLSVEWVFAVKFWLTFSERVQKLLRGPSGFFTQLRSRSKDENQTGRKYTFTHK